MKAVQEIIRDKKEFPAKINDLLRAPLQQGDYTRYPSFTKEWLAIHYARLVLHGNDGEAEIFLEGKVNSGAIRKYYKETLEDLVAAIEAELQEGSTTSLDIVVTR